MALKVYVAGAWAEQHFRARPMIAKLREAGVEITCDWTQAKGDVCACGHHRQWHRPYADEHVCLGTGCGCTAFNGIGAGSDAALTDEARLKRALADLQGVLDADVVWLLAANDKGACGSWVELGGALMRRLIAERSNDEDAGYDTPYIVVSGPKNKRTIFTELADVLVPTDEEGFGAVISHGKAVGGL